MNQINKRRIERKEEDLSVFKSWVIGRCLKMTEDMISETHILEESSFGERWMDGGKERAWIIQLWR